MKRPLAGPRRRSHAITFLLGVLALGARAGELPDPSTLHFKQFAHEPMVQNAVAVSVDEQNRVFVTSVVRRQASDLDIRAFPEWVETDLSLRSLAEKQAFLRRELVAANSDRYASRVADRNGDGVHDWHDLLQLTDRISRLEDTDGDGVADVTVAFPAAPPTEVTGIAAGLESWDGVLYATTEPDIVRFTDADGDGRPEHRDVIAHGFSHHFGYGGHNFSGAVLGLDGRLYTSVADRGMNVTDAAGVTHANPHSGAILRCELDGSHFEIYATGLRNLQEPAFDAWGNILGVDNDGDMPGEQERFVYVAEGSDSGWRMNWQYRGTRYQPWLAEGMAVPPHPTQPAYLFPPLRNYKDGPAGFAYNPGTALTLAYRDYFFLATFPSRNLYAFQAEPAGAAFRMVNDHLVANGVLMVGLSFGPDGKLYVADWSSEGYAMNDKGGVWTLDDPAAAASPLRRETARLIAADWRAQDLDTLRVNLGHPDQRVRMKAQFELVRRGETAVLLAAARDPGFDRLGRGHAIWGLGQLLRAGQPVPTADLLALLADPDPELRAQTARIIGDARPAAPELIAGLPALLADPADRPRFLAALALHRQPLPAATPALLAYLARDGADPYHRHAAVMGLAGCTTAEQLAALTSAATVHERLGAVVALRRQHSPLVSVFLHDPDPAVVAEAAMAIHDDESIPAALPALAALLPDTAGAWERTTRRALNAALRLRAPDQAARVATFAADPGQPTALRLHALELLQVWTNPPRLDDVEGCYRLLAPVDPATIAPQVASALRRLARESDPTLARAAWEAGSALGLQPDTADLLAIVQQDTPLAADALEALRAAKIPGLTAAATAALRSPHPRVRVAALTALAQSDPDLALTTAVSFAAGDGVPEARAALALLKDRPEPAALDAIRGTTARLRAGTLPPELALDVVELAASLNDPAVTSDLAAYQAAKDATDPLAPYLETLRGGDAERGRALLTTSVTAQCTLCHRIDGPGSNVGPPLGTIGLKQPRYLLEALVNPGAAIPPGYGFTTVTLRQGEPVTGSPVAEDATSITLRLADGTTQQIARTAITDQTPTMSPMPPLGQVMSRPDLRDILAYLQTLRGREKKTSGEPE